MHTTKKTILAAAVSILVTGYSHADEHFSEVVQDGSDNTVVQSQSGLAQWASSPQEGFLLSADIEQTGVANSATTDQSGAESAAQINQDGATNLARVVQFAEETGHRASIFQTGGANDALVEQLEGVGNTASITQLGDLNSAQVQQEGFGSSYNGVQNGSGNIVSVEQYSASLARTEQTGSDNTITLTQDGFPYGATASITQDGTGNEATVVQQSPERYPSDNVSLTQIGADNVADVSVNNGFGNLAFTQDGIGNELTATQSALNASFEGSSVGDYNSVNVNQDGRDLSLTINQYGDNNDIDIDQSGASSYATFEQNGNENYAAVLQTYGPEGFSDAATIMQNGTGNSATVMQRE